MSMPNVPFMNGKIIYFKRRYDIQWLQQLKRSLTSSKS